MFFKGKKKKSKGCLTLPFQGSLHLEGRQRGVPALPGAPALRRVLSPGAVGGAESCGAGVLSTRRVGILNAWCGSGTRVVGLSHVLGV